MAASAPAPLSGQALTRAPGVREAAYWHDIGGGKTQCDLCAHLCKINEGHVGVCGIRQVIGGKLYTLVYALPSAGHVDPIEKKPLYHFHPTTRVLSFGTIGCNMRCRHCQNFEISQARPDLTRIQGLPANYLESVPPEDVVGLIDRTGAQGIAWTYNEPTIWFETNIEGCKRAKDAGYYSVWVSNGFATEDPMREISPFLDAINIDVKAFTDAFYRKVCNARLQPVLDTVMLCLELGIHTELTYLIIPGENDDPREIRNFCRWVAEGPGELTATHFSRFHPDYKMMGKVETPAETLEMAYGIAKEEGLKYVYNGNVVDPSREMTYCHHCGAVNVKRRWFDTTPLFRIRSVGDDGEKGAFCRECGKRLPILLPKDAEKRVRPSQGLIQSIYDAAVPSRALHK
ncbi:MAG TPA: AmmeMemoRadiSam system radical SAM enzyme [Candidatus Thermoplasmatota archaeon]|nr:AmmeMemoRadiSam system radical SAM enzyme [Candidatus Thermoplasmatota archaeon]